MLANFEVVGTVFIVSLEAALVLACEDMLPRCAGMGVVTNAYVVLSEIIDRTN